MRNKLPLYSLLLIALTAILLAPGSALAAASISAADVKAGDMVTIEGSIAPGQDLFIAIASQQMFAPKDTDGVHETKRLKKDAAKKGFNQDSSIPALYYMLTSAPESFGKVTQKKFGGPSFFTQGGKRGLYKTTYFKLAGFDKLSPQAKSVLGPIKSEDQWNFYRYAHESGYGINTIVKERPMSAKSPSLPAAFWQTIKPPTITGTKVRRFHWIKIPGNLLRLSKPFAIPRRTPNSMYSSMVKAPAVITSPRMDSG